MHVMISGKGGVPLGQDGHWIVRKSEVDVRPAVVRCENSLGELLLSIGEHLGHSFFILPLTTN